MTDQPTGAMVQIKRVPNLEKPVVYVNNAHVMANQWDVQMYFSLVRETNPGEFSAVDSAVIIMTPEHALAFSRALQQTLENYSKQQGHIREARQIQLPLAQ